jgi:hypothetical protein
MWIRNISFPFLYQKPTTHPFEDSQNEIGNAYPTPSRPRQFVDGADIPS